MRWEGKKSARQRTHYKIRIIMKKRKLPPTREGFAKWARDGNEKQATNAEKLMLAKLNYHKIPHNFQHIIDYGTGFFIADFYIKKHTLVIEVDGSSHDGKEAHDAWRDSVMKGMGYNVLRLKNDDVELFDVRWISEYKKNVLRMPENLYFPLKDYDRLKPKRKKKTKTKHTIK